METAAQNSGDLPNGKKAALVFPAPVRYLADFAKTICFAGTICYNNYERKAWGLLLA